jgi:MFS family permease
MEHGRPRVLVLLMLQAALCQLGRVSMSVAGGERIMAEHGLSPSAIGLVYSSYLLLYTVAMVPGGWLIDRRGPRLALLVVGVGGALGAGLTGLLGELASAAWLLPALIAVRAATGAASAPLHPGAARGVALWVAPDAQPIANGLVTGAALAGIAASYAAFGFLMDRLTWPRAFLVVGALTALVAAAWAARAPRGIAPVAVPTPPGEPAWWRQRALVLLTASYAAVGYVQYLFIYWMQFYFDRVLVLGRDRARLFSTVATLAMGVGMAGGGALCAWCEARLGRRRGRAIAAGGALSIAAALLAASALGASRAPLTVLLQFATAMAALGACESAYWTTATDVGGARGGTSAAILNTGGNAGGMLAPVVTPLVGDHFGWRGGLGLAAVICLIGAALWARIDPRRFAS